MSSPIVFVLVGTRSPGNLGAACRTAKAFGMPAVRLVHSAIDPGDKEAVRLAHGALDVLAGVEAAPTLDRALADCARAIATTGRVRDWSRPVLAPEDLAAEIATNENGRLAIVFGPEDRGLTNDELARCDAIVSIPIAAEADATLSLPSALAIVAHFAHQARGAARESAGRPAARGTRSEGGALPLGTAELDVLLEEIRATLAEIGFRPRPNETRFRGSLRDFLARARTTHGDRLFLRSVLAQTGKWKRRLEEAKSRGRTGEREDAR